MTLSRFHKLLMTLALLLWFVASAAGAHKHICLDGQEPPVSIHLGSPTHHLEPPGEDQHLDLDVDIAQTLLTKLKSLDLPLLVLVALLALLPGLVLRVFAHYHPPQPSTPRRLRPPLRAPPLHLNA